MFQTWRYIHDPNQEPFTHRRYKYCIIDTDFEEEVIVSYGNGIRAELCMAVIEVYSKRNLPVAPNIVALFQEIRRMYNPSPGLYSYSSIVAQNREYNPKFAQYEDDLNKYLVLL